MTQAALSRLGQAALHYAEKFGWPVHPLHGIRPGSGAGARCTCGRPDCGNPGKHPRTKNGFLDASTDRAQIVAWWQANPDANIGMPTGLRSRVIVLDVDPRNGGDESLEDVIAQLPGGLPPTVEALTGGGGRHILFRYPERNPGDLIHCCRLANGLDWKADGGYIVLPPSEHASGRSYAWEASSLPGEAEIAPLPIALLELASRKRSPARTPPRSVPAAGVPGRPVVAPATTPLEQCFVYLAFEAAGMLRGRVDATRQAVVCPFEHEHTARGGSGDTSTIVFAPDATQSIGWFHCSHSHCQGRSAEDALRALPATAIAQAKIREGRGIDPFATPKPTATPAPVPAVPEEQLPLPGPLAPPPRPPGLTVTPGENAWQGALVRSKDGSPKGTYGNLCLILRNAYGQRLSFNEMVGTPCLDARPLGDADVGRVREDVERHFALVTTEANIIAGVRQVSEERRFHPVRDYLRSLKWDAKVRLPGVAPHVLGADDPLHARMLIAWFAQAAKRAMDPGCKADAALVLYGNQGYLKSTFFSILAGEWFSDTRMDIANRDGLMQLASSWIYEWGEIDRVTSRTHASDVKAFITSQFDTYRQPFARAVVKHPRSSVIVGSTNEKEFLTDPTGSRRFWIITVPRRLEPASLQWLRDYRDQLWAEAVVNVESNYQAYLTLEEEQRREELAEEHQVADPIQDAVHVWLNGPEARRLEAKHGWVTMGEILELALKIDKARWDRGMTTRVGYAMKRLRWSHVRRIPDGEAKHIWCYMRPIDEVRPFKDHVVEALLS